jgi:hypothetical protein
VLALGGTRPVNVYVVVSRWETLYGELSCLEFQ